MNKHGYHHTNKPSLTLFRRTKKYIVMAITFILFFALCNYYMGLLSFDDHPVAKPVIPTPEIPLIDTRFTEDDGNKYNSNDNKQGNSDNNNNNNKNSNSGNNNNNNNNNNNKDPIIDEFPDVPEKDDGGDDSSVQATCKHTRNRDYSKDPIVIAGRFPGREENCDIPCVGDQGTPDAVVGYRQSTCPHVKSIFFTMENSIPPAGAYDIVANTQLSSDVPLPYFSWAEYNFMNPVQKKTATAQVAAFISNCGPQRRLQWMEVMMQNGVTIDSFGSCMKNKAVPADLNSKYGSNYNALKIDLLSRYKFTMAFENSATDDYVTEKLFGVFVSGSVPLYDGAPNGKKFGPSPRSMLFADDFGTPEKMAEFILYLDSNDTAYEEYLSWKRDGPSDDWVALVDLSKVHSNCRLCIRTADLHRKEVGQVKHGKPEGEKRPSGNSLELHVRERGKFWLRNIYLTSKTIEQLKQKALQFIPHDADAYVYAIYNLWTRMPVETDADVAKLSAKTELEIIFVVPQDWRDKGLMPS